MKKIFALCIILLLCVSAFAQTDWQKMLKEDAVKIAGNKMVIEEYDLIKGVDEAGDAVSYQIYIYSEAANSGFISRDNFIMYTAMIFLPLLMELGDDFETLEEPIGEVDFELKLYMTAQGIQVQFNNKNEGTSTKNTLKWADMFAE